MLWRSRRHRTFLGIIGWTESYLRKSALDAGVCASLQHVLASQLVGHALQQGAVPCLARGFNASAGAAADTTSGGPRKEKLTAIPFKVHESSWPSMPLHASIPGRGLLMMQEDCAVAAGVAPGCLGSL